PTPSSTKTGLVPETLGEVCLPVLSCQDPEAVESTSPRPTPTTSGGPTQPPREWGEEFWGAQTRPPTPPESRPQTVDSGRPVTATERADADEPRVDLLWPNPFAHELAVPMQDQRVVRPSPPASDVLGTALTIALLGSAVLATRIVQQRRLRTEPAESIPFEPARAGNGRHRLA
ncbi:hypothetical protein, partial [Nonomuraea zeae]